MSTTHAQAIIATNAVFIAISAVSVFARFYARRSNAARIGADDWLVLVAWGFSAALAITNIIGVPVGYFGTSFESLTEDQTIAFLKIFFATQFFYVYAVAFVKLTILFLYRRIFSAGKTPVAIWVLVVLTIGWLVSFFFATLFQIYPIWCNWLVCEPTANYPVIYVLSSVTDILLDISILCLPAFFIGRLQMSFRKKIGVAAIFGLGIFCVIASVARLVYTVDFMLVNIVDNLATDFDISVDNIILWSGIEACVSTACANLPCYGPLVLSGMRASSGATPDSRDNNGQSWPSKNSRELGFPSASNSSGKNRVVKAFWWDSSRNNTLVGNSIVDRSDNEKIPVATAISSI